MTDQLRAPTRQAVLLDSELIRRRRVELCLTERQVGRLTGQSGQLVRRIEAGLSHEGISLRVANRLAGALGLPLPALFLAGPATHPLDQVEYDAQDGDTETSGSARHDLARLGAVLGVVGEPVPMDLIEDTLNMPSLQNALTALDSRLRPLGLAVEVTGVGVAITAAQMPRGSARLDRVRRENGARRPLGSQEAKMLLRVLRGEIRSAASLNRPSGMILGKLARAGAIEMSAGRWAGANPPRLTPEVRYSLLFEGDALPDAPGICPGLHPQ